MVTPGSCATSQDVAAWRHDTIRLLLVVAVAYAVVEGTEAVGLWFEKRWAEYLTVLATAGFLPLELHELTVRVTVLRVLALIGERGRARVPRVGQAAVRAAGRDRRPPRHHRLGPGRGHPAAGALGGEVLTTTVFRAEGVETAGGTSGLAGIADVVAEPGALVWVDLCDVEPAELEAIRAAFDLHEMAMEDVTEQGQRAKLDHYPTHAFVVAYSRAADGDLCEVDLFVGEGWLVSVRERNDHGELFDVEEARRRHLRTRAIDHGVGFLLYTLLDALVDGYFQEAELVEDHLEDIEDVLFDQGPPVDGSIQRDLLGLRKELIRFRRKVVPLRDVVLAILRREVPWVEEAAIVYFEDVLDHLLRITDQIDTLRELMGNVVDASLGLGANRMNEVMKKMTSWGAILIVATLIAGIYGMNFRYMPELGWHWGYFERAGPHGRQHGRPLRLLQAEGVALTGSRARTSRTRQSTPSATSSTSRPSTGSVANSAPWIWEWMVASS